MIPDLCEASSRGFPETKGDSEETPIFNGKQPGFPSIFPLNQPSPACQLRMTAIAPNLTYMVGELVGARLISQAGQGSSGHDFWRGRIAKSTHLGSMSAPNLNWESPVFFLDKWGWKKLVSTNSWMILRLQLFIYQRILVTMNGWFVGYSFGNIIP